MPYSINESLSDFSAKSAGVIPTGIVFVPHFGRKDGIDFNHFNFRVKVGK